MRRAQQAALIAAASRPSVGSTEATATVRLSAASYDIAYNAQRNGCPGSSHQGHYIAFDDSGHYFYSTHDGTGYDPLLFDAGVADLTAHPVELGSGNRTPTQVAAAYASAINAAAVGFTASSSGDELTVEGTFSGVTLRDESSPAAGGRWGALRTPLADNTVNAYNFLDTLTGSGAHGQHGVWDRGDAVIIAIGMYLAEHDVGEQPRLAVFTGGTAGSLVGTTLRAQGQTTGDEEFANALYVLSPSECFAISDGTSLRIVVKGTTATTRSAFHSTGSPEDCDFTSQNLEQYTSVDPDETVAWGSTLDGETLSAAFAVYPGLFVVYRTADGEYRRLFGVPSDVVLTSVQQSDIPAANVSMWLDLPTIAGLRSVSMSYANGNLHSGSDQFRGTILSGGSFGSIAGMVPIADVGQFSGTATDAWVTAAVDVSLDGLDHVWLSLRSDGVNTTNLRYAGQSSPQFHQTAGYPSDYRQPSSGNSSEYETFAANTAHSTDPAVPFEALGTTHASDQLPENFPGLRLWTRVAGSVLLDFTP